MGSERDETYTILVKGKPLASVKADLIHAFLSVSFYIITQLTRTLLISDFMIAIDVIDCRSES